MSEMCLFVCVRVENRRHSYRCGADRLVSVLCLGIHTLVTTVVHVVIIIICVTNTRPEEKNIIKKKQTIL